MAPLFIQAHLVLQAVTIPKAACNVIVCMSVYIYIYIYTHMSLKGVNYYTKTLGTVGILLSYMAPLGMLGMFSPRKGLQVKTMGP